MSKEGMKILIITKYLPPFNIIAAHRPYSWAKYWTKIGHDVTVLTTEREKMKNDLDLDRSFCRVIEIENKVESFLKKL